MTEVLGRDSELARLADVLRSACHGGGGGALMLRGEAGIGKSALLEAASRQARELGMTVLAARGTPAESRLPFGALHQVLWPLLRDGAMPTAPRESLRAAFGQVSIATPDLYGVAFAALDLLSEAADAGPLLVIAEDAHWLDEPTAQVLSFVAQRLGGLPVAMLIAVRDGYDDAFTESGVTELVLGPLADEAAPDPAQRKSYDLPLSVRPRLLDAARGNPLALLELPAAVRDSAETETSLGSLLPVTARLERAFAARLPEIPEADAVRLARPGRRQPLHLGRDPRRHRPDPSGRCLHGHDRARPPRRGSYAPMARSSASGTRSSPRRSTRTRRSPTGWPCTPRWPDMRGFRA